VKPQDDEGVGGGGIPSGGGLSGGGGGGIPTGGAGGGAGSTDGGDGGDGGDGVTRSGLGDTEGGVGAAGGRAGHRKSAFWVRQTHLGAIESKKSPQSQPVVRSAPKKGLFWQKEDQPRVGDLDRVLIPLYRRALGDSALRWGLLAVAGWAAAVSVLLAWSKLSPTSDVALIAAVLGVAAALIAGGSWTLRRPNVVDVARVADARLDLSERLGSALFYAHAPGAMEARLRADAVGAASRFRPAQAFPLRRHRHLVAMALTIALVAVLLAVTPNPQAASLARQVADRQATAQARKVVVAARRKLGHPSSPEGQKIAAALQSALSQLAKAGSPLASLVALSNLSRQLTELDNPSGEANQAADAAASDALAGAAAAQRLASDLASGNLKAAAAGLSALAAGLSALSPAQRKALAEALAKAAVAAGNKSGAGAGTSTGLGSNQPFAGGLARASSALSAGHLGTAGQALKSAASGAAASAAAVSLQQQLAADQAAVQNEETKVASQAQAGAGTLSRPGSGQSGAGRQRSQGLAPGHHGTAKALPGGRSGAPTSSGASSSGLGSGASGSGGTGLGDSGSGGSGSTGQGSSGGSGGAGSGGGSGAGPGGSGQGGEGGAGQPGQSAQVVGEQVGTGGNVKTTPYQAVLPTFEKTALQGLGSHVVSPDDQGAVRSYFSSLGSGR
jgi:hypothetical protein